MSDEITTEELIINDSFANYCFQSNEEDILFWQEYILAHPFERNKIREAMQIVLGLRVMLQDNESNSDEAPSILSAVLPPGPRLSIKKIIRYAAAIAAVLLVVFGIDAYFSRNSSENNSSDVIAGSTPADKPMTYSTAKGEKKMLILPDSTRLYLGAGSTLRMEAGFGSNNRGVYLKGEALFDVTQNKNLPFIVHSENYDVEVLGTIFNVKAYPEDRTSETSLLKGKVVISLRNNSKKITLKPNQKAVIDNKDIGLTLKEEKTPLRQSNKKIVVVPLSYNSKDSIVMETAWTQNRLEIINESFSEIKNKLQRWYNVKIIFADEAVSQYTFTATFTKESIEQALKALQYSYHFTYKTEGDIITISK